MGNQIVGKHQARLQTIAVPHPQASILTGPALPVVSADDDEDLLCGGCGAVVGEGVSRRTMLIRFAAPFQLALHCPGCGAYNVVPSTRVPA